MNHITDLLEVNHFFVKSKLHFLIKQMTVPYDDLLYIQKNAHRLLPVDIFSIMFFILLHHQALRLRQCILKAECKR